MVVLYFYNISNAIIFISVPKNINDTLEMDIMRVVTEANSVKLNRMFNNKE